MTRRWHPIVRPCSPAFQQVEDNLAALRILEEEAQVQEGAVKAARQSVAVALNQYKAGTVNYLNVIVVQAAALNNEITAVDIQSRRMTASRDPHPGPRRRLERVCPTPG